MEKVTATLSRVIGQVSETENIPTGVMLHFKQQILQFFKKNPHSQEIQGLQLYSH